MEGLIPINKRTKQFAIRIAKLYSFSPFPQLFNLSPLLFTSDSVSPKPAAHRNMSAANPTTATPPLVSDPLSPQHLHSWGQFLPTHAFYQSF